MSGNPNATAEQVLLDAVNRVRSLEDQLGNVQQNVANITGQIGALTTSMDNALTEQNLNMNRTLADQATAMKQSMEEQGKTIEGTLTAGLTNQNIALADILHRLGPNTVSQPTSDIHSTVAQGTPSDTGVTASVATTQAATTSAPQRYEFTGNWRDQDKPEAYTGTRVGDHAKIWVRYMEGWFTRRAQLARIPAIEPAEKIALAVSNLKGRALSWWVLNGTPEEPDIPLTVEQARLNADWKYWTVRLCTHFADTRTQEQRLEEFYSIVQKGTVQDFKEEIDLAAMFLNPRLAETSIVHQFRHGLKRELREKIDFVPQSQLPSGYQELVAHVHHIENQIKDIKASQHRNRGPIRQAAAGKVLATLRGGPTEASAAAISSSVDHDGDIDMMNAMALSRRRPSNFRGGDRGRGREGFRRGFEGRSKPLGNRG